MTGEKEDVEVVHDSRGITVGEFKAYLLENVKAVRGKSCEGFNLPNLLREGDDADEAEGEEEEEEEDSSTPERCRPLEARYLM